MNRTILLLTLLVVFAACRHKDTSTDTVVTTTADVPGPPIALGEYPLAVGHMWVYDSGDTIRAVADTVINGMTVTKLTKTNTHYTHTVFCVNKPDGLYMVAANFANAFLSLMNPAYDVPLDTLKIPDTAVRFTRLPVNIGAIWEAHIPNMRNSERMWIGFVTTTTLAGKFNCVKLNAGYCDEYYSEKGLVKQVDHIECFVGPCPEMSTKLVYVNF